MTMLISPEETGQRLEKSQKTLANWRCAGRGPAYIKIGDLIRYDTNDLEAWLQSQKVTPGSKPKK